ncbi:restriction endonuclease subunit S [Flammeovirga sp. OC4]|uniref:restriction endonuclease subunit S n=1 Tax=Flammeovirga sp. OC4 TaxID=1382345 RepID=UPI0006939BB8|nr:restriction endonuclease subunit S [Flammeovirga sp. OC4]
MSFGFKVPDSWSICQLVDVKDPNDRYSFTGGPFGSDLKSEHYKENGVRIIQLQNIGSGSFIDKSKIYTSEEKADELVSCNIYPGEIILAKMHPAGRSCLIPNEDKRYLLSSDGIRLKVDKEKFDNEYIFQFLNTSYFLNQVASKCTGTTRARIGLNDLKEIKLAIPPLPEQKKIASILSTVDQKLEQIDKQITKTQELKKGLSQRLLTRGIGHTKFKQSKIGEVPESWEVVKINDVSNVVRGASPRPAGDPRFFDGDYLPWITVAALTNHNGSSLMKDHVVSFLTEEGSKRTRILEPNTVLLSNSGATLGVPKILTFKAGANDGIAAFLELNNIEKMFLYYLLESKTSFFRNDIAPGSGQPNLNTTLIGNVDVVLPPIEEQKQIASILSTVDHKLSILERKKSKVAELKKGLMQGLLSGKVRVS